MKRRSAVLIGVVLAAPLQAGCFEVGSVQQCGSPSYSIVSGTSIPINNPCESGWSGDEIVVFSNKAPDTKPWPEGMKFSFDFEPGVAAPVTLEMPAGVAPQLILIDFKVMSTLTKNTGFGTMTVNVTGPDLTVRATADPPTINSGDSSQLAATVAGGVPPYSHKWSPSASLTTRDDIPSPTANPTETTIYTVEVTDHAGSRQSAIVTVTVRPPLIITTDFLPSGVVGNDYLYQLAASDTSGQLSWSLIGGMLPNGLALQPMNTGVGFLSGTPTSAGTFNFTVQVVSSDGRHATHDFTVEIDNPVPAVTILEPPSTPAGTNGLQLTMDGSGFAAGATVAFGTGAPLTPSSITPTRIVVTVPAAQLSQPGTVAVSVTNPPPGGGTTDPPAMFQVTVPVVAGLVQTIDGDPDGQAVGVTIGGSGRFVAVLSSNNTTARKNVFLRDTCLGAANSCSPSTALASAIDGSDPPQAGNNDVQDIFVDSRVLLGDDGNSVGFTSRATNLIASGTNSVFNAFLRFTCANASQPCTKGTALASATNTLDTEPNGPSNIRAIAPEGRYVVFRSTASNILDSPVVPPDGGDLYLRDTCVAPETGARIPGCNAASARVSQRGVPAPDSNLVALGDVATSGGGRFVVFSDVSQAGFQTAFWPQLFLTDTCGLPNNSVPGCTPSVTQLPLPTFSLGSGAVSSSADGRFVLFTSAMDDTSILSRVYVLDTCRSTAVPGLIDQCDPNAAAALTSIPTPLSLSPNPSHPVAMWTSNHAISTDGRYVLFGAGAYQDNGGFDGGLYVVDTCRTTTDGPIPGCQATTKLVSVDGQGHAIPVLSGQSAVGDDMALSSDGHYVVFLYRDLSAPPISGVFPPQYPFRAALAATGF